MSRLERLFQFLEASPNDSFINFAIAKEYEKASDHTNALTYYQKIVKHDPDYVGTYYHLGKLLESLQKYDVALTAYTKGIEIAKKIGDQHALGELAEAKMIIEDIVEDGADFF